MEQELRELEEKRRKAQSSLKEFVTQAWPVLEPVTPLVWNWHLDLLCEYLVQARQRDITRLIINVPPRTMKSTLVTVCWPVWWWVTEPATRFMMVSYADELAVDHSVFRRNLIQSEWFQERWNDKFKLAKDQNLKTQYENSQRGRMMATSIFGSATGKGGDVLIVDDPQNPKKAFSDVEREIVNKNFDATFRTRLNDPSKGVIVIVMQRLHERDLTGHLLAKEPRAWKQVSLPAIAEQRQVVRFPFGRKRVRKPGDLLWKERLPQPVLDQLKVAMGSWAFAGQYQQSPAPLEGGTVKYDWLKFYRELPARFDHVLQSWDCSFKESKDSDYVVGQVWGRAATQSAAGRSAQYYLLDQVRGRMDFVGTKNAIRAMSAKYPQAVTKLVEDKANGPAVISALKAEVDGLIAVNPEGGKESRMNSVSALFEAGNVFLPEAARAPWIHDYMHELCTFPKAAHDDQVDATSQALVRLRGPQEDGFLEFSRREMEGRIQ